MDSFAAYLAIDGRSKKRNLFPFFYQGRHIYFKIIKKENTKMKIADIIKEGKLVSEVNKIKRYSAINISFINKEGKEDETQLDVCHSILTRAGRDELADLWTSMASEFNASVNSVTALTVVASANSYESLCSIEK